jgi:uncharacterized protein (DUF2147 family)
MSCTQVGKMSFLVVRKFLASVSLVVVGVSLAPAGAPNPPNSSLTSPVGRWKTIDDATGKAKSIVAIRDDKGTFYGTIEKIFDPPVPKPTCYLCTGTMKDRPLIGLQVLSGFKWDGNRWSGGQVLDPETGKIYRASLELEDGGAKLRLHGYIGIPLFGRTQYWLRVE